MFKIIYLLYAQYICYSMSFKTKRVFRTNDKVQFINVINVCILQTIPRGKTPMNMYIIIKFREQTNCKTESHFIIMSFCL